MTEILKEIRRLIDNDEPQTAIEQLDLLLARHPEHADEAYYLRGNAYRKLADWQSALNSYQDAIALNPESPAAEARNMLMDILNFYNKDMFNQ